jgi:hypothetical protein
MGKQGRIVRSLRILLLAMSVGAKNKIALDIVSARRLSGATADPRCWIASR